MLDRVKTGPRQVLDTIRDRARALIMTKALPGTSSRPPLPWMITGGMAAALFLGSISVWLLAPADPTFGGVQASLSSVTFNDQNTARIPEALPDPSDAPGDTDTTSPDTIRDTESTSDTEAASLDPDDGAETDTGLQTAEDDVGANSPPPEREEAFDPTTGGFPRIADVEIRSPFTPMPGKKPLKPAPDIDLVQSTAEGPLPIVSEDGEKLPWSTYARPFRDTTVRPRISLMLTGLGVSAQSTVTALQALPSEISVSFPPYVRNIDYWSQQSRQVGHEIFIELPMEPYDFPTNDPGPMALMTTLDQKTNRRRLDWILSRFTGYVGVINLMGGRFTSSEQHMTELLTNLKKHGLSFIEQRPAEYSQAQALARKSVIPFKQAALTIDEEPGTEAIRAQLQLLENKANTDRTALGIMRPYPITIREVLAWRETLEEKGLVLAPVSAILTQGGSASPSQ